MHSNQATRNPDPPAPAARLQASPLLRAFPNELAGIQPSLDGHQQHPQLAHVQRPTPHAPFARARPPRQTSRADTRRGGLDPTPRSAGTRRRDGTEMRKVLCTVVVMCANNAGTGSRGSSLDRRRMRLLESWTVGYLGGQGRRLADE